MKRLVVLLLFLSARLAGAEESDRRLVLMVQYIATDYRGAVAEPGRVANEVEYAEHVQTAREAVQLYQRLKPSGAQRETLESLAKRIESKAAPDAVERDARELVERLRLELSVTSGPLFWPEMKDGAQVFASKCASCHGTEGRGDGPAASALNPKPPDMTSPEWADQRSPFQLFNTITLGIPKTAMVSFEREIDHHTRWALAFYLLTLRTPAKPIEERPWIGVLELSSASNTALAQRLKTTLVTDADTALAIADAARRQPPRDLTIAAAMTRMRNAIAGAQQLVNDGKRLEATELVSQTYYDAVEPVEPALMQVSSQDLPEMELRITAVRSAISQGQPIDTAARSAIEQLDRIVALAPDSTPATMLETSPTEPRPPWSVVAIGVAAVLVTATAWRARRRRS